MQLEARLRAFAAVARQGSFSRAANEIFVSQPAVSKHLAALEAELGKTLVERQRGGSRLTPAGRVLADYALRAEALLANARRALDALDDADAGVVRVAASGIPADYLLPRVLPAFVARFPRVDIDMRATTSEGALSLVRGHEVELAVLGGFTTPADLESEPLVDDEIVLVGPPELGRRKLRRSDLAHQTWITREQGSATRASTEVARWQLGLDEVKTLAAPSWSAVKETVAAGGGIAAISRLAIERELAAGALVVLDVPRWRLRRTISLVAARDVPLTPAAARFRQALHAYAHASGPTDARGVDQDEDPLGRAEQLASLVAEAATHLGGFHHDEWSARLEEQRPHVDAAVAWAAGAQDWQLVVRLLGPSWLEWIRSDYPLSWREALEHALEAVTDPSLRLLGLPTLGWLAFHEGHFDAATNYANQRLDAAKALGRDGDAAGALSILAAVAADRGDYEEARRLGEEAVVLDRRSRQDSHLIAHLANLAAILTELGELDAAESATAEVATLARAHSRDEMLPFTALNPAIVALLRDEPQRALELLLEGPIERLAAHADAWAALDVAGVALVRLAHARQGVQLLALAEDLLEKRRGRRSRAVGRARVAALEAARTELGAVAFTRAGGRGRTLTVEAAYRLARSTGARGPARRSRRSSVGSAGMPSEATQVGQQ